MSKIAVIGLVGESVFLTLDRHQAVGETAHATSIHREWGGKGYNQAVAAARFGSEVAFLGAVCECDARTVERAAAGEGMTPVIMGKDTPTAYGVIATDSTGDNRVTVYGGAVLSAADVDVFRTHIEACDVLLLNNEVPEDVNLAAAKIARASGKIIIMNPAPIREICKELLSYIDIFTPNEHEREALGDLRNVVVTLGGEGALIKWLGVKIAAPDIESVVDTTGAGDTFNGVLASMLGDGEDITSSTRLAVAAASLEVTKRHVMPAIPSRREVMTFIEKMQS